MARAISAFDDSLISSPRTARRHTLSASVTYMTSLMPRRISQTLAGQEVK